MTRNILIASAALAALAAPVSTVVGQQASGGDNSSVRTDFPIASARAKSPAEAIYLAKCQYCHIEMGPGTITLAGRVGPDKAMLANRDDLTADYVKAIVRTGLNGMPALSRVEVSDAELEQIATYLSRPRPETALKP